MELTNLGPSGPRVSEIGICLPEGSERDAIARRAYELECRLFHGDAPIEGALVLPAGLDGGYGFVQYNILDQLKANKEISRISRAGEGVIATHVLAGGALAGRSNRPEDSARIENLKSLLRDGRTMAQLAIQFVLANESVSCALVRVSSVVHLEEVLAAPDATPLTGQDLEHIFENWANRFD